jgi:branched-chain amino acid transport system ATP-binding protein
MSSRSNVLPKGDAPPQEGLAIGNLVVRRESSPIIREVSLEVPVGRITVLLGANGGGKTTLLEAVSGVIPATSGTIRMGSAELVKASRRERVRQGLGHVEQGRKVFRELTVEENMSVASRTDWSFDEAFGLFPELELRRKTHAGLLSGGEQQMLVVARALAARPRILMVDEMSLGLAPRVASRLVATMRTLADRGLGVLLVEQFAALALKVGDSVYVLTQGRMAYHGSCEALVKDPDILRRAYLGERPLLDR